MNNQYNLLLVSYKTDKPEDIKCSVQMNAYGIYNEFSKLSNVSINWLNCDDDIPIDMLTDFVLIHSYFGAKVFKQLELLRSKTKFKIMIIMEVYNPTKLIDHQFIFRSDQVTKSDNITIVKHPVIQSLLNPTKYIPKEPGSILLDHIWHDYDESKKIYSWLYPFRNSISVSQMCRPAFTEKERNIPSWITKIPETDYVEYLQNTAKYENFILTRYDPCYGHSILDMAYRGTRVIVPYINNHYFCNEYMIESLNLDVCTNHLEFSKLITTRPTKIIDLNTFTDMSKIVSVINEYCQKTMSNIH